MAATVSVVILGYNKAEYTRRCLAALTESVWRPLEVILVDNGSTDATRSVFRSFADAAPRASVSVELMRNGANVGAVTGRNQALAVASGEFVAFMDNDVVVRSRDWLGLLVAALRSEERGGIAGPKLIYPFPPFLIQCAGAAVSRTGRVFFRGRGERRETPELDRPADVQCLISACWLMRRAVYEQIGPLDEAYNPVQFEDIDYCYRAREAGWRVLYVPAAEMYHFENVTTAGSQTINSPYQIVKNGLRFKRAWRHMFEREDGPSDEEWRWAEIPSVPLDSIGPVEQV